MSELFREGKVQKTYWAITGQRPEMEEAHLLHYLTRNEKQNKTYAHEKQVDGSQRAELIYKLMASSDRYHLLQVNLLTGRQHQIRAQLAHIGCVIKGDMKYGSDRSNKDGSISLHSRSISFVHPVSKEELHVIAPTPDEVLWKYFEEILL